MSTDDKDRHYFEAAMRGVRPLQVEPCEPRPLPPPLVRRQPQSFEEAPCFPGLSLDTPVTVGPQCEVAYRQSGISPAQWRRFKNGRLPIEASLDLHGFNREAAQTALLSFLHQASVRKQRTLCVIHGKGNPQSPHPTLKNAVIAWLQQIPSVIAYCSAPPAWGGTGALLIRIAAE